MGQTVEAKLVYGFHVDDDNHKGELPWEYDYRSDLDRWWREVSKQELAVPYPYDRDGNMAPGFTDEDSSAWWSADRQWKADNPTPWAYEFFCVPGAPRVRVVWGAKAINLDLFELDKTAEYNAAVLQAFMIEHDVTMHPMGWYLLATEG